MVGAVRGEARFYVVGGDGAGATAPPGSWVRVDGDRAPTPGDVVVARTRDGGVAVGTLAAYDGARWLLSHLGPPRALGEGGLDLVGVVDLVVRAI